MIHVCHYHADDEELRAEQAESVANGIPMPIYIGPSYECELCKFENNDSDLYYEAGDYGP